MWNIGLCVVAFGYIYYMCYLNYNRFKKKYWQNLLIPLAFVGTRLLRFRHFQKCYVDKVLYDTKSEEFHLFKRSFLLGSLKKQLVHRRLLMFTSDEKLNMKQINYLNMVTLEGFKIGYEYAWKDKALFSHLLEQRIKSTKF